MFVRTAMSSLDRRIVLLLMFVLTCIPNSIFAQANEDTTEPEDTIVVPERREGSDTLEELTIVDDSTFWARVNKHRRLEDSLKAAKQPDTVFLSKKQLKAIQRQQFRPNPQRALWLALVLPGAGQIYNRKYWKLPIFYGGFVGCTYALVWNQKMYRDYSQAYLDIMDDNPETKSYMDILPPRYNISGREEWFKTFFKNRKNRYRRYRDLSAFAFIGVYALSVIDAYVDAQLSVFDISPDLSLSLRPAVIQSEKNSRTVCSYGIGCNLNF